jgi:uncharacterized cupin superfamily protein
MAKILKHNEMELSQTNNRPEDYTWNHTDWLSDLAKAKQMEAVIISLDPGKFSYPYHYHHNSEEMFVILSGSALLRTPDGFQEVHESDVIFFELGPDGAHQLYNHTDKPCKYLDLSVEPDFDVCEYPDTEKINAYGNGVRQIHYKKQTVDYFEGEESVLEKWKDALKEYK